MSTQEHSFNYVQLKVANEARLAEEARLETLRRNILVLILEHLQVQGFKRTADALQAETSGALATLEVCDNVDLLSIVQEFEAYYTMRFGKPPKITRKLQAADGTAELRSGRSGSKTRLSVPAKSRPPLPQIESPTTPRREGGGGGEDHVIKQ